MQDDRDKNNMDLALDAIRELGPDAREFPFFAVPGFQQGPCYRQSVFTRDRDTEFSTFIIGRTQ